MSRASMRAVIFDLGGVVADSPILTIRKHGEEYGIGDVNRFLGDSPAWDGYMQGKMTLEQFLVDVEEEAKRAGYKDG